MKFALHFIFLLSMIVGSPSLLFAQDTTSLNRQSPLSDMADELEHLLKSGAKAITIAKKYEQLAMEFKAQGQTQKAITYFNKAADYFKEAKKNDDASGVLREVAKLQEVQQNSLAAAAAYQSAAELNNSQINRNDAYRIEMPARAGVAYNNVELIEKSEDASVEEQALVYYNQGVAYEEMAQPGASIVNKLTALGIVELSLIDAMSPELVRLQTRISNDLVEEFMSQNRVEEAFRTKQLAQQSAMRSGNIALAVQNSIELADLHLELNQMDEALLVLKEAYRLALSGGRTLEAKLALVALVDFFSVLKDVDSKIFFYEDFISQLEELIIRDSSMIDQKIFFAKEERIEQLENERALQNQLLIQTRNWNYGIVVFFVVFLIASAFLLWSFMKVRMQNKRIALQSLRREMNPHFIFNSLNSVNGFIAQNDEIKANKYLTSYAQLMRTNMEVSSKDFIPLDKELDLLRKYLELEHLRFGQHFDFEIHVNEDIQTEIVDIPGFLIQPHLENAIWHGLRYKKEKGLLILSFKKSGKALLVTIEDNGIGIEESKKLKTSNQKSHASRGFSNIQERIELLNGLYGFKIKLEVHSPLSEDGGTKIEYLLPLQES